MFSFLRHLSCSLIIFFQTTFCLWTMDFIGFQFSRGTPVRIFNNVLFPELFISSGAIFFCLFTVVSLLCLADPPQVSEIVSSTLIFAANLELCVWKPHPSLGGPLQLEEEGQCPSAGLGSEVVGTSPHWLPCCDSDPAASLVRNLCSLA